MDAHGVSSAAVIDALIFVKAADTGLCSVDGVVGSSAWLRRINFSAAAAAGDGKGSGAAAKLRGGGTGRATTPGNLLAGAGFLKAGKSGEPAVSATVDGLLFAGLCCDTCVTASLSNTDSVSLTAFSSTMPCSPCSSSALLLDEAVFVGVNSC